MSDKKQFRAESQRLLEMMVNSIYTHKEIFLRELISNASDAIDKMYYKSLTDHLELARGSFEISVAADKDARTLTVSDNGIGMTADDLEENLGVIAQSGSLKFKKEYSETTEKPDNSDDLSVIGQFGVGFYSAFMVAERVEVRSKAYGSDKAYLWASAGSDGYTIEETDFTPVTADGSAAPSGTRITLFLKADGDDRFSDYLEEYRLNSLIKKYSDYIRFPIKTLVTIHDHDGDSETEEHEDKDKREWVTQNSMIPLWKKSKAELTDADYIAFYRDKFHDYTDPLAWIHSKTEGAATYNAMLFIPEAAPYDYYSKNYEKGLQLYSSGVMVMDKCADLLPDYFSFVKGLVDSEDLSLNISRELLQHDRQLKVIAKSIERGVKNELKKLLQNDRDKYLTFWKAFGNQVKFGLYNGFGMNKETLQDLVVFDSSFSETDGDNKGKKTTFEEYVSRMKEDQTHIYYAAGASIARIKSLPQVESVLQKGYEILYLTENVDEFCLQILNSYDEKPFMSVQSADLKLETEEELEQIKAKNEESKSLFERMKSVLSGRVADVRLSTKLVSQPVCISSAGAMSVEMERILEQMPNPEGQHAKAEKVLELNPNHALFTKLQNIASDEQKFAAYTEILYGQALLLEGVDLPDPGAFVSKLTEILTD